MAEADMREPVKLQPVPEAVLIALHGHVIDVRRQELRDASGAVKELRPQAFAVLLLLARHAGRPVLKEEFMRHVWGSTQVTDDSLVQAIGDIRRALGDGEHRIVKTVPRRGYLMVPEVPGDTSQSVQPDAPRPPASAAKPVMHEAPPPAGKPVEESPPSALPAAGTAPPHAGKLRLRIAGMIAGILVAAAGASVWLAPGNDAAPAKRAIMPDRPTLAVLPFQGMDGNPGSTELGIGYANELAGQLAQSVELRVIAPSASFEIKEKNPSPREVGKVLGARYLVQGGIQQQTGMLRVAIQVVDADDGRIVWSTRRDITAGELSSSRIELIKQIAGSVHSTMRMDREYAALGAMPKVLDAYSLTLRAMAHKHQFTAEATKAGRLEAEEAIRLDPGYAPAWVYLAFINLIDANNRFTGLWNPSRLGEVLDQAKKAIALDPNLPVAYQALCAILSAMGKNEEALQAAQRAVELSPNDADNLLFLARIQAEAGLGQEALRNIDASSAIYPIKPSYFDAFHARILWSVGRHAEALERAEECLRKAPQYLFCKFERISALVESGKLDAARSEAESLRKAAPHLTTLNFTRPFRMSATLLQRRLAIAKATGFPDPE